jgi:hypothetical protein
MTMGIIGIVAGTLGLVCGACGTAGAAFIMSAAPGVANSEYMRFVEREAPLVRVAELAKPVALLLLSPLLIAGSAAVMFRKGWGRWLVLAYAVLIIPVLLFHGIYEFAFVFPAADRFFQTQAAAAGFPPGAAGQMKSTKIGVIASVVFWGLVCVAMVGGLFNPVASRDLAPPPPRRRPVEDEDDFDEYDDEGDRPRRRRDDDDDRRRDNDDRYRDNDDR